ncbi:hypothetical protein ABW20_dc0102272 [Dactylellina cionopaga]|nr:hypothetical protein ABW20_dc0102272 [Dactylellina cionopaga]
MTKPDHFGFKLIFPGDKQAPALANYEPWQFFEVREPADITIEILSHLDAKSPKPLLASYRLHKRILAQSPTILRYLQKNPFTQKIQLHGENPAVFTPILAYLYLHDFKYLSHSSSREPSIRDAEKLLLTTKISIHDSAYRSHRYIAVHDVPSPQLAVRHASQHPEYQYTPFTLYNMSDFVKDLYLKRVYGKGVAPMVVGDKGNLRWRVVEGVIARSEILETFEFQLEDHNRFFEDVVCGLSLVCEKLNHWELEQHQLYKQLVVLMDWAQRTNGRKKQDTMEFEVSSKNEVCDQVRKLGFHEDKENTIKKDRLQETDDDEEL